LDWRTVAAAIAIGAILVFFAAVIYLLVVVLTFARS